MGQVIALCEWGTFQHYKERDPSWVKLYRNLLTGETWVLGTDASRLLQVASILLAARYHNATPLSYDLIRKVASLDLTERQFNEALTHLVKYKFVEIQGDAESLEDPASTTLATCTIEKRREEKSRGEERERPARKCPPTFAITDDLRKWAREKHPGIDIDAETDAFRDYTFRDAKTDWPATWRSWIRKAKPVNGHQLTRFEQNQARLKQSLASLPPDEPNPLLENL